MRRFSVPGYRFLLTVCLLGILPITGLQAKQKGKLQAASLPVKKKKRAGKPDPGIFIGRMQQMVAAAHPLATKTALGILKKGGNAIDAAVAAAFVLSVVEPHSSGLGGGGFMLYYNASNRDVRTLDFRERAPFKASRRMYSRYGKKGRILSRRGHLAVATPGMVMGMEVAHKKYGRLSWKKIIEPARRIARKGFRVYERLARILRYFKHKLKRFSGTRSLLYPRGRRLRRGQRLIQKNLAWTLRRIQKYGARDFYRGRIAYYILREMRWGRGLIRRRDLRRYRAYWGKPVVGNYRGHRIYSMGSPSSGGVHLIQMMNLLSGFSFKGIAASSAARYHLLIEVMRLAFADRARYQGDARFAKVPNKGLISPSYAEILRKRISSTSAMPYGSVKPGDPRQIDRKHTTHISVIDRSGNAVSMTLTINTTFGSGVLARGIGVFLNNEMDDFTTFPGKPNAFKLVQSNANVIQPGKTPLSSMTPTLVFRGKKLCGVLGSPGGPTIITTVMQIIQGMVDHHLTIQQAVRFPRMHHQWKPSVVWVERLKPSNRTLHTLRKMGHRLRIRFWWGNAMALWVDDKGKLDGASDPRMGGLADGF